MISVAGLVLGISTDRNVQHKPERSPLPARLGSSRSWESIKRGKRREKEGEKTGRRKRKSRKMRKKEERGNNEDLSPLPPDTQEEHGAVPWE